MKMYIKASELEEDIEYMLDNSSTFKHSNKNKSYIKELMVLTKDLNDKNALKVIIAVSLKYFGKANHIAVTFQLGAIRKFFELEQKIQKLYEGK